MLEKSLIIALLVLSIWYTMREEQIFEGFGDWLGRMLPEAIHKPIFSCPICMVPWHGSILYWVISWDRIGVGRGAQNNILQWIVVVIVAMGINIVIMKMFADD
jgi:hypothetical protein